MMPDVRFFYGAYAAAEGADAAVLATEWDVLRALDPPRLARMMKQPVFVDLRNVYPHEEVEEARLRGGSSIGGLSGGSSKFGA
jgi:UDPglucose 6-dehydrogenase